MTQVIDLLWVATASPRSHHVPHLFTRSLRLQNALNVSVYLYPDTRALYAAGPHTRSHSHALTVVDLDLRGAREDRADPDPVVSQWLIYL